MFSAGFLNYYDHYPIFFNWNNYRAFVLLFIQLMFGEQMVSYYSQVIVREIRLEALYSESLTNPSAFLDKIWALSLKFTMA